MSTYVQKISENRFNYFCEKARERFNRDCEKIPCDAKWQRIKYNSCYVVKVRDNVFLKSYNTIVAQYNIFTHNLKVYDYYSATTCQHVGKFERFISENGYDIFVKTFLYKRNDRIASIDYDFDCTTKWYKSLNNK